MGGNTVIVTICVVYFLVMIGTGIYASRKIRRPRISWWQDGS